jgi:hypothetical protein
MSNLKGTLSAYYDHGDYGSTLHLGPVYLAWGSGLFWFRVFGHGLYFSDSSIWGIPFSERMGISETAHIGKWRVGRLW